MRRAFFMRKNTRAMGKKFICGVSAAAILAGSLAGCGENHVRTGSSTEADKKESIAEKYREKEEAYIHNDEMIMEDAYAEEENDIDIGITTDEAAAVADYPDGGYVIDEGYTYDTREYSYYAENKFVSTADRPLSTFAADRDTASYSNVRNYIENGALPDTGAVRIEELINYFDYEYKMEPESGEKFAVYTEYADCPWNSDTRLMMVGINTEDIDFEGREPSNLVFLIDTSGSMYDDNKLPLAQVAFKMLAGELDSDDRVSIVTYAGSDTVLLSGTSGDETYTITEALDGMYAEGSTNGSDAIITAYELAEKNFIPGGNNRVILATDGDLNVGLTSESDLVDLITEEKDSGIFLSVLGFGSDNLKDNKLEALADNGNGSYAFIDSVYEAKKVLVDDMGGTLCTVAKDVKFQVEFNPANVKGYRLIGYENRMLADTDFDDDTVDGGEIGAGHMVTALYEVVPSDSDFSIATANRRYAGDTEEETYEVIACGEESDELAVVNIRYKEPDEDESQLVQEIVKTDSYRPDASADMEFVSAVAAYGMLLKDSAYRGSADYDLVLELAVSSVSSLGSDSLADYRQQFIDMVGSTKKLAD